MWLLENSRLHIWLTFVVCVIFLLDSAALNSSTPSAVLCREYRIHTVELCEALLESLLGIPFAAIWLTALSRGELGDCLSHLTVHQPLEGKALPLCILQSPSESLVQNLTLPCEYTKTHWLVYFKWVIYMTGEFYLNKAAISTCRLCSQEPMASPLCALTFTSFKGR